MVMAVSTPPTLTAHRSGIGTATMLSAVSRSHHSESGKGKPVAARADELLGALRDRGLI